MSRYKGVYVTDYSPKPQQPRDEVNPGQYPQDAHRPHPLPDDRMTSYLYCFNEQRDYFACHEYLESLWLDTGRPTVLKGLIQAAVCLYHLQGGNVRGGARMWRRARGYLLPHIPVYQMIDLRTLVEDIDAVFARVPAELEEQTVSAAQIAALHLPTVTVHIVDEEVRRILPTWQPAALDDGEPKSDE